MIQKTHAPNFAKLSCVSLVSGKTPAGVRRRRDKLFAWMDGCLAAMPVLVILPRSLYAFYVALPAWFLWAACFVTLRFAPRRSR